MIIDAWWKLKTKPDFRFSCGFLTLQMFIDMFIAIQGLNILLYTLMKLKNIFNVWINTNKY